MKIRIKYHIDQKYEEYNSFEEIPNYDSVVFLYCENNGLTSLPELPNSLTYISCYNNQLTILLELPNSLTILSCGNNHLTSLPELPNSLKELYCWNNELTSLPELPISLIYLECEDNRFIESDNWNSHMIKYITYSFNQDIQYFIENIISNISIECKKCNKTFIQDSRYIFKKEYTIKNSKCQECK